MCEEKSGYSDPETVPILRQVPCRKRDPLGHLDVRDALRKRQEHPDHPGNLFSGEICGFILEKSSMATVM